VLQAVLPARRDFETAGPLTTGTAPRERGMPLPGRRYGSTVLQMILNLAGIAVFAASGAVVGVRKGFDLFGIAVMGVLTGVGGGILRDLLLDISPPYSIQHWANITVAIIAAALATVFAKIVIRLNTSVLVLDAFGMGFFATAGAALAVDNGASWFAAVLLGMLSAIAGSIVRDVLARDVPMVMGPDDLYAIPAMLGSITYVAVDYFVAQWIGLVVGTVLATALRLAAMFFHWRLPTGPRELIT
jgi:uncharacterized membrane protein YeiH